MTNQQINERIAKLCGWTRIETGFGSQWAENCGKLQPPDYAGSLDDGEWCQNKDCVLFGETLSEDQVVHLTNQEAAALIEDKKGGKVEN